MRHDIVEHSPDHYECRNCHQTWEFYPVLRGIYVRGCPGLVVSKHTLIQHNPQHFECSACGQTWPTKPRSRCPGLRVYPQYGHEPLLTKLQLGYAGYEISKARLPAPVGCFQSHNGYGLLYDPQQATLRQAQRRQRKTITISEIFWPRDSIYFIEKYIRDESFDFQTEFADMAYHISLFTGPEVERSVGDYLHLPIAACLLNVLFPDFQRSSSARAVLVKSIVAAYEKYRAHP